MTEPPDWEGLVYLGAYNSSDVAYTIRRELRARYLDITYLIVRREMAGQKRDETAAEILALLGAPISENR